MEQEDLKLLTDWFEANQDHKLNIIDHFFVTPWAIDLQAQSMGILQARIRE